MKHSQLAEQCSISVNIIMYMYEIWLGELQSVELPRWNYLALGEITLAQDFDPSYVLGWTPNIFCGQWRKVRRGYISNQTQNLNSTTDNIYIYTQHNGLYHQRKLKFQHIQGWGSEGGKIWFYLKTDPELKLSDSKTEIHVCYKPILNYEDVELWHTRIEFWTTVRLLYEWGTLN